MCIANGVPESIFLVNEDLTTGDGAIVCRQLSAEELAQLGWRVLRLLRLLKNLPITF